VNDAGDLGSKAVGAASIEAGANAAGDAGGSTLPPEKRLPLAAP
jgi:hypothetical protein